MIRERASHPFPRRTTLRANPRGRPSVDQWMGRHRRRSQRRRHVRISATGQLQYSNAKQPNGPEGLPRGFADLVAFFS